MAVLEEYNYNQQESPEYLEFASLRLSEVEAEYESRRRVGSVRPTTTTTTTTTVASVVFNQYVPLEANASWYSKMFPTEFIGNTLIEMVNAGSNTERPEIASKVEYGIRTNSATLIMNNSNVNTTEASSLQELVYRHSLYMTAVYCVAYLLVFAIGLVGNCFVIAVVFRTPRMRTVTNFFIVNLAVADILVIIFCLPATLMSNIFVRKYFHFNPKIFLLLLFMYGYSIVIYIL